MQEGDERGDVASRPKATELRNFGKFQGLASARPRDCPGESTSAFGISGARKGRKRVVSPKGYMESEGLRIFSRARHLPP